MLLKKLTISWSYCYCLLYVCESISDTGTIRASSVPENEGRDVVNPISDDENEYETIEQDIDSRSERIRIYNSICESIEQNANCSAEEIQPNLVTNPIDNDGLNDEQSDRASIASSVHSISDENSPLVWNTDPICIAYCHVVWTSVTWS